jgi:hypothetical protein
MNKVIWFIVALVLGSAAQAQSPQTVKPCYGPSGTCGLVTTTNPLPVTPFSSGGTAVIIDPNGEMLVATTPFPLINDTFSTTLDTTNRWNANNSGGTATAAGGSLSVVSGSGNGQWDGITSKKTFRPAGIGLNVFGVQATIATLADANTGAIWGVATVPGSPTPAVPVTDGYVFRLDATGALFAEVWSSGTAVSSTNVTTTCNLVAGTAGLYRIQFRQGFAQFLCGATAATSVVAATATNIPSNQDLLVNLLSVTGTSPGASRTVAYSALAFVQYTPGGIAPALTTPTADQPSYVITESPNGLTSFNGGTTNPSSTLTLTSTTTAYTAGQLVANNATAGSITTPSFTILNQGAAIGRLRLISNDTTSTAWVNAQLQVDLWTATPTWTNGDRGTWLPATGSASHLAIFTCVAFPGTVWGDGLATECAPATGSYAIPKLATGSTIFWSLKVLVGGGTTGASKTLTLIPEALN